MTGDGAAAGDSRRAGPAIQTRASSTSIPGTADLAAFTLGRVGAPAVPVMLAVPHAGRTYPAEVLAAMRDPGRSALRLEDRLVDLLAISVARETGAGLLVANAPRAMIDLNRAPDDIDWEMVAPAAIRSVVRSAGGRRAGSGLGLVPRRLPGIGEVWKRPLPHDALEARIARIHKPYHDTLARQLESLRDRWGAVLLLDLHSMPPLGPKHGAGAAADFVLGDRFGASCHSSLSANALDYFGMIGRAAAHNRPYAGGYVLDRHAAPARGIHAMQIEVCRTTYLDLALREAGPGMAETAGILAGLVRRLSTVLANLSGLRQAAE